MMRLVKYSVDVKGLDPRMNTIDVGPIKSDEKSTKILIPYEDKASNQQDTSSVDSSDQHKVSSNN